MRVPAFISWPGQIPAGQVVAEMASTLDLFPTLARLGGANLPRDRSYPGNDLGDLLRGTKTAHEERSFFYYFGPQLQAVRCGAWKLFLPIAAYPDPAPTSLWFEHVPNLMERQHRLWPKPVLYNLSRDIGEVLDVAAEHPDVVERLTALARAFDARWARDRRSTGVRRRPEAPRRARFAGPMKTSCLAEAKRSSRRDDPQR